MILTFDDLAIKYKDYTDIKGKIRRDILSKQLIPLKRGLYETNAKTDGKLLAGVIYSPSYLSFDYALSYYEMIPEAVYQTYASATYKKYKTKRYENDFGLYTYRDVPNAVYNIGVKIILENDYSYQIAIPEKALCDKLYSISPVTSLKGLESLLFDDLRIDMYVLKQLNKNTIDILAPLYCVNNLKYLLKLMEKLN